MSGEQKQESVLSAEDVDRIAEVIERYDDPEHWSNLVQYVDDEVLPMTAESRQKAVEFAEEMRAILGDALREGSSDNPSKPYEVITLEREQPMKWFKP